MTQGMDDSELQAAISAYAQLVADKAAGRPVSEETLKVMGEKARKAEQSLQIREAARRTVANLNFEWTDEKRKQVEAIIRAGRPNRRTDKRP